jgi:hypothetical protein
MSYHHKENPLSPPLPLVGSPILAARRWYCIEANVRPRRRRIAIETTKKRRFVVYTAQSKQIEHSASLYVISLFCQGRRKDGRRERVKGG